MLALLQAAFAMGWPILLLLGLGLLYVRLRVQDPDLQRRALSKGAAAIIALVLFLIAVANVQMNFFGDNRLLPISLSLITAGSFLMALYFARLSALFKIGGFMFLMAAALAGFGNWLRKLRVVSRLNHLGQLILPVFPLGSLLMKGRRSFLEGLA